MHVTNSLRLLSLPNEVTLLIEENKISAGHAKVLVGLDNAYFLAKKIIEKKLSVRQAENLTRALKNNKTNNLTSKNPNLTSLETSIEDKTGIKVFIKTKPNIGRIKINYAINFNIIANY